MGEPNNAEMAKAICQYLTEEQQKAYCEKLRAEAEEAIAAMDPTRSYVPGSGCTAWENTLAGNYMSASNPYTKLFVKRGE